MGTIENRPKLLVIATGGTIASSEGGSGLTPSATGEALVAQVPGIRDVARIDVVQLMNIDSSSMAPEGWLKIAERIERSYQAYDGFVVLHGTDTLGYTAAGLSYLIQRSPKPIVLTGSQLPMENPETDARVNVHDAVLVAADSRMRDVLVVFGGKAIAGTRARKQRTRSFDAFESVNLPVVAKVAAGRVEPSGLAAPTNQAPAEAPDGNPTLEVAPVFYHELDTRVQALKLTPGMDARTISALKPLCDALIVETFGIGGIPEYGGIPQALLDWAESGRLLILTTQVPEEGCDLGVYEVGRAYLGKPGIVQGGDLPMEALLAKAMWALGQTDEQTRAAQLFAQPINHG